MISYWPSLWSAPVAERAGPDDATWRRALLIVLAGLRADGLIATTPDGFAIDRLQGR